MGRPTSDEDEQERWEDWTREPGPQEAELAEAFMNAEVGDSYAVSTEYDREPLEIKYINDRPGVRELRLESNVVVWIVREKYVFKTHRDGEPLWLTWVGDEDAIGIEVDDEGIETISPRP